MFRSLFLTAAVAVTAHAADAPLALVRTIPLKGVDGKLDHLAVDTKGQRLYVANKPNNTLDVVDLKTGALAKQIPDQGKISGVEYAPDLDMVYVGNGAGTCNGFAAADLKLVFSTPAPGADNVHYDAANKTVVVGLAKSLLILDAMTGAKKGSIDLPGAVHGFSIDAKRGKVHAVLTKPSVLALVDLEKGEVTAQYPLMLSDGGSPITFDAAGGRFFVGCPKMPFLAVFEAATGKELGGVAIPGGVDDIHFDAARGRVYASCGDGALAVIEKKGDAYEVTAKLETPKSSRTCVFADGMLYLGVPKQPGADGPEVRVYAAK